MSKKLVFESVANVLEWLLAVVMFAFLASVVIHYVNGKEASSATAFMWGLLLERVLVAFAFVYNRVNQPRTLTSGG